MLSISMLFSSVIISPYKNIVLF